jgi:type IX secretion system PorP/SprF family membrane protein
MRIILLILIFPFSIVSVYAQTEAGMPVQFHQFFKTYNLINPAGIGRDSSLAIKAGNKAMMGAFSGVRTFYVSADKQLGNPSSKRTKHVLGIYFINDKEGSYINKSRASLLYAIQIPLNERLSLNGGIAAGFINYSFKATNVNAGGSAFSPNADLGLWLEGSDFNLGISINQIIAAKLTPIEETYTISKYSNLIADKTININPYLSIKPALAFRYINKQIYNLDLAILTLIQNNILAGLTYKYQKGFSLCVGIESLNIKNEIYSITFSYYYPSYKYTYSNSQSIELSLGFNIHKSIPEIDMEE